MVRGAWRSLGAGLLGVVLALRPAGAADPEAPAVEGPGTWPCASGGPARTREGTGRAVRERPVVAWTLTLAPAGAGLESEPLAWRRQLVLAVHLGRGVRQVQVLDLATGAPLAAPLRLKTDAPLLPVLVGRAVVVQGAPGRLEAYLVEAGRLQRVASLALPEPALSTLVHRGRVIALCERHVVAWDPPHPAPAWTSTPPRTYAGEVAARDDEVYAVAYGDSEGTLYALDWATGAVRGQADVGSHRPGSVGQRLGPRLVVLPGDVFVHHAEGVPAAGGGTLPCTWCLRTPGGRPPLRFHGLVGFDRPVLGDAEGWLANTQDDAGGGTTLKEYWRAEGKVRTHDLLGPAALERIGGQWHRAARAGDTLYVGDGAVDLADGRVLWRQARVPAGGFVPLDGFVLDHVAAEQLRAICEQGGARPTFLGDARARAAAAPLAARALTASGEWVAGTLAADGPQGPARFTPDAAKAAPLPLPGGPVEAVCEPEGRCLYLADLGRAASLAEALADAAAAERWLAWAEGEARARRGATASYGLSQALARGAAAREVGRVTRLLAGLGRGPSDPRAAAAAAGAAEVRAARADWRERLLAGTADSDPAELRTAFLRARLDGGPGQAAATAAVGARLPELVRPAAPLDAHGWAPLLADLAGLALQEVVRPTADGRDLTREQREVGAAAGYWRPDVRGLKLPNVFAVLPERLTPRLARFVLAAEAAVARLDRTFGPEGGTEAKAPLYLQVYEDRAAFERVALMGGFGTGDKYLRRRDHAYYAASERMTRVCAEADREDEALADLAWTLVWHWMMERHPGAEGHAGTYSYEQAGWMAPLGVHMWMAAGAPDGPADGAPPPECVRRVAAAGPELLIPWPQFFAASGDSSREFPGAPARPLVLSDAVGGPEALTPRGAFYEQSGAFVCWCLAQGDRERAALRAILTALRRGEMAPDSRYVAERFGVDAETLGARVVEWARARVATPRVQE